jgi:hypothetical protein
MARGHGAAPVARPPRRALSRPPRRAPPPPGAAAACRPQRGLELGPACLWRVALISASAWPRAVGLGMAPLPLAARARVVRAVLWHGSSCPPACSSTPGRARLPLDVPVYPPMYFMRAKHVVYINKWKLNLEIGYVSYFM